MGLIRDRWRTWERQQLLLELALTPTDLPSSLATDAEVAALASTNLTDSNLIARHKGVWTINTSWLTGDIVQVTSAVANGYPLGLWRCTTTHLGGVTFSGTSAGYWVQLSPDPGMSRLDGAVALGNQAGVVNLDASAASVWTITATADLTLNFINVPTNRAFDPLVIVKQGGSGGYTVSFSQNSSIVSPQWDTTLAPTATSTVGAETSFSLSTPNGGTTWYGAGATPAAATNLLLPTDFPPLQAWTAPPYLVAASKQPVAGVLWCTKLKAPAGVSLSKLWYYLSTAATAPTNSFLAIYDTAGNRLSLSANLSATDFLGSQSTFRGTSMPVFTVPADGVLIVAVLVGAATTVPTFSALQNSNAAGNAIAQDGSKGYGVFSYGTGLTAMPSSLTLNATNCTVGAQAIMFGVS